MKTFEEPHPMATAMAQAVAVDEPPPSSPPKGQYYQHKRDGATYYKSPSSDMEAVAGRNVLCILSSNSRKGQYTLPETVNVGCVLGEAKIDLSDADFIHPQTTIHVGLLLGEFTLVVPRGVRVDMGAIALLSDVKSNQSELSLNAPLIVVKGGSLLASVKVCVNEACPPLFVVE